MINSLSCWPVSITYKQRHNNIKKYFATAFLFQIFQFFSSAALFSSPLPLTSLSFSCLFLHSSCSVSPYLSSPLFPSSVPCPFINLNLSVCAPWSWRCQHRASMHTHRVPYHQLHLQSASGVCRHRRARKENQITFVCPVIFSSKRLCLSVFVYKYKLFVCLRLCIYSMCAFASMCPWNNYVTL